MKKTISLLCLLSIFFNLILVGELQAKGLYEGKPIIHSPAKVGNYTATPFLYYIPATGSLPISKSVENLPAGLSFDPQTGIISGTVNQAGEYKVTLQAQNKLGTTSKEFIISIGDELLLTPPMGWNSWNTFGQHLTEGLIIETAEAMIANGMRDVGYTYINIDDFWQLAERADDGHIQVNLEKFPNGIKYVADYLHARGFKLGIYSDAAEWTCGGVCGSLGYEGIDALDFASWGVDLLKYDYCHAPGEQLVAIDRYTVMGKALRKTNRSIVYSICEWGEREPWLWAKKAGGHYWRTTWDIRDRWYAPNYSHMENGIMNIIELSADLAQYAGPGAWNDPDMLVVGISGGSKSIISSEEDKIGCTPEQYRSHMSLWAIMAAPLLAGNDVRDMDANTLETLTNPEIIAINQDALGKQGERKIKTNSYQIWVKELENGAKAVACLNTTDSVLDVAIDSENRTYLSSPNNVRDVWAKKDLGKQPKGMTVKLQPYECKVYVIK